ncbi:MAG: endonuclease/exonuclease/phosphatase family protein, partial [Candidatus Thioglobus sp.]
MKSSTTGSIFLCETCRLADPDLDILPFHEVSSLGDLDDQINITHTGDLSDTENAWKSFEKRGLHFIHLNINSLLDKIDELRFIAEKSKPTIIGITESKIDESVPETEFDIQGYTSIRNDRTRHGGGVVLYIKEGVGFNRRDNFSNELENIFVDILLPKTKPILIGILYNPFKPDFLDKLSAAITGTDNFDNQEVYLLGDFNINLWHEGKYIFQDEKVLSPREIHKIVKGNDSYNVIKYQEFCSLHSLKQLIKSPTRITENKSSLLDHVLTNYSEKISQSGEIDIGVSDHQLIYCTRKVTHSK